jgi:hypothetical protein
VIGPVTGGLGRPTIVATSLDLASRGYEQVEYFVTGTARSFSAEGPLGIDGRWRAAPAASAPYMTRVLVHRPIARASGSRTAIVEWLNVSAGFDTAPDWLAAHNVMMREGFVWIGVSAQADGVQGSGAAVGGLASGGLRAADPERYEPLRHPGDSFSYDIYSQVGALARGTGPDDLAGGSPVDTVVAIGESQSAFRLVTYVNAVHPTARIYDGFLVHSRGGAAAALSQAPEPELLAPEGALVRTDLEEPALLFQTETDFTRLGYAAARQPDAARLRVWEVAGTAHADAYTAGIGFDDVGDGRAEEKLLDVGSIDGGPLGCAAPVNAGPAYAVLQAALLGLARWSSGGAPPAAAAHLELDAADPVSIARDEHGNARGGIRTPFVDVPIAALRGDGNDAESFCRLFGTTRPFDALELAALYADHDDYVARFERSTAAALDAGFLLPEEAANLDRAAAASGVLRA